MGGIINDFLKTLKPKEKAIVISSMAALGVVLIGIVLLIAFCSKDTTNNGGIKPHEHSFDKYSLEFDAGLFNVKGACSFEGCDEAKILETGVTVTNLPKKEATCTEQGEIVCVYSYNGTTLQYPVTVAKKSHNFAYTLNGNQLSGKCTADGCNETNEVTATSVVQKSHDEATCKDVAKTVYTVTMPDGSEIEIVSYGKDKLTKHTLNGTLMDTSVVYEYGTVAGITATVECGKTGEGKFVCDDCGENITVKVKKADHKFQFDYTNAKIPTATETGSIAFTCLNKDCTLFNNKKLQLPAIKIGAGGNSAVVSEPTATEPAYVKYEYESYFGKVSFAKIPYTGEYHSHNFVVNHASINNPTAHSSGTVEFKCTNAGCEFNEYKRVFIDPIEIGVNAEIISEATATEPAYVRYELEFFFGTVVLDSIPYEP